MLVRKKIYIAAYFIWYVEDAYRKGLKVLVRRSMSEAVFVEYLLLLEDSLT